MVCFKLLELANPSNEQFNQDISSWDVSNVEDMRVMFWGNKSFNRDLSSWNVTNVNDCSGFNSNSNA